MSFAVCSVPVSPMRKEAAHRSEMVSQLLFGEFVQIVQIEKDFVQVKCLYDGYEGWCQKAQLTEVTEEEIVETKVFAGNFSNEVLINNTLATIPFGAPVYYPDQHHFFLGKDNITYLDVSKTTFQSLNGFSEERLKNTAFRFLNTGYLWGGKSVFGIDCSGFAQQVFKFLGIPLLRDAYLQATQGTEVNHLSEAQMGDLLFFTNEEGRITHVGILLSADEIIHASGKVRIDKIDEEGIITEEGNRTHKLHSIRRYN